MDPSTSSRTILLGISRGLVCRNILRTGVIEALLADPTVRIVLVFPKKKDGLPQYLREEFADPRITIEEAPEYFVESRFSRAWIRAVDNLVYTSSTDILAREGSAKVRSVPGWWYPFHKFFFSRLSRSTSLKRIVRWIERSLYTTPMYDELFAKHRPDVVFTGAILSKLDVGLLKAAERFRVPSVGMQKGWDNLQRVLIRTVPTMFVTQNKEMVTAAVNIQGFASTGVRAVGFPQFDQYTRPQELLTRDEVFAKIGAPSDAKILFFGSEGLWTPQENTVIDLLLRQREEGAFSFPLFLVLRPHFSNVDRDPFGAYRGRAGVYIDDTYRHGRYWSDRWDPTKEDMRFFASLLHHASVLVTFSSTLSVDAACMDLPIINLRFGGHIENGVDKTERLYRMDHYQPVLATGAVVLVDTEDALKDAVVSAVENPSLNIEGRRRLREDVAAPFDGHAASRIAETLLTLAYEHAKRAVPTLR